MKKYVDYVSQKSPQLPIVAKGDSSKKTPGKWQLKKQTIKLKSFRMRLNYPQLQNFAEWRTAAACTGSKRTRHGFSESTGDISQLANKRNCQFLWILWIIQRIQRNCWEHRPGPRGARRKHRGICGGGCNLEICRIKCPPDAFNCISSKNSNFFEFFEKFKEFKDFPLETTENPLQTGPNNAKGLRIIFWPIFWATRLDCNANYTNEDKIFEFFENSKKFKEIP